VAGVTLAVLPAAGGAADPRRLAGFCTESGDQCAAIFERAGSVSLELYTAAKYYPRYQLCVQPPRGAQTCRTFPVVRIGRTYGSRVRWAKNFPDRGAGVYRVTWDRALKLSFRRPLRQTPRTAATPRYVLTHTTIGPVNLGATKSRVQRWLGRPARIWTDIDEGRPPVLFDGELWGYRCGKVRVGTMLLDCWTLFGFRGGKLASFATSSKQYRTARGTTIGTPLQNVLETERSEWHGWEVQCPGVTLLGSSRNLLVAQLDSNTQRVDRFYLSKPGLAGSFSACGS
jgi:hypothetical protein